MKQGKTILYTLSIMIELRLFGWLHQGPQETSPLTPFGTKVDMLSSLRL